MRETPRAYGADDMLLRSDDAGVTTLTLNRPTRGNALSRAMIATVTEACADLAADTSVKVVILEGAGGRVFSAGHDLKEIDQDMPRGVEGAGPFFDMSIACSTMMQAIMALPQPVIAKVRGVATAAGAQLVATCDLAWAADTARFATPGVNIGLWCHTPMVALTRGVHRKHAMEMLLTGRMFPADHAVRIGLLNDAVPDEELDAVVDAVAREIASKSSATVAIGKAAFYRQIEEPVAMAYRSVSEIGTRNRIHPDADEGINAFVEKRPPVWVGR